MAKIYSKEEAQRHCDRINSMLGGWFSQGAPLKEGMPGTHGPGPEAPSSMEKLSAGELTKEQAAQIEAEGGARSILPPALKKQLGATLEREDIMQLARERRARKQRRKLG